MQNWRVSESLRSLDIYTHTHTHTHKHTNTHRRHQARDPLFFQFFHRLDPFPGPRYLHHYFFLGHVVIFHTQIHKKACLVDGLVDIKRITRVKLQVEFCWGGGVVCVCVCVCVLCMLEYVGVGLSIHTHMHTHPYTHLRRGQEANARSLVQILQALPPPYRRCRLFPAGRTSVCVCVCVCVCVYKLLE